MGDTKQLDYCIHMRTHARPHARPHACTHTHTHKEGTCEPSTCEVCMCLPMLGVALGSFYFLLPSLHELIITLGQVTLLQRTVTSLSKEQQQQHKD